MSRLAPVLVLVLAGCTASDPKDPTETDDSALVDTLTADTELAPVADAGEDRVVAVGEPLTLTAPATPGEGLWDLGDGTLVEGFEVTHTYAAPGNHVAVFQLLHEGRRTSDTARVTAYLPPTSSPPSVSSTLLALPEALWVTVPEAGHVARIDPATQQRTLVPTCAGPRTLAKVGSELAVACEEGDAIAFIDLATYDVRTVALPVGSHPYGVAATPDGAALVSAAGSPTLLRIDDHTVTSDLAVGPDPRTLAVDGLGRPWASRLRAAQTHGGVYGPDGEIPLAKDPGPDSDTANRGVPTSLHSLTVSPDGGTVYVGGTLANVDRGQWVDEPPSDLQPDTTVRATLRVVDTATGSERFASRRQYDNHGQINAMALTPLGNWLWIAHQGTQTLARIDAYTLTATGVVLGAGEGIDGLAVSPDGRTLYVHAWLDRLVHAYDISDPSVPSPPRLWSVDTVQTEPLAPVVLLGKRLFHASGDPRLAKHGYIACHTCHPDGRDDGLVWDFTQRGEGLRNTLSLRGHGGTAMGPLHWSANFDEVQDFEHDIRNAQGGTGLLDDADWQATNDTLGAPKAGLSQDLDALAAYVTSLGRLGPSPHPAPEDGPLLFTTHGCATCHDPATHYTDSSLQDVDAGRHDVGTLTTASGQRLADTLDGIDTPTLLDVWATGPYLHDGSAPTVEDAIRAHHTDDLDGAALSPGDLQILADYVRSLPQAAYQIGSVAP